MYVCIITKTYVLGWCLEFTKNVDQATLFDMILVVIIILFVLSLWLNLKNKNSLFVANPVS